MLSKWEKGEQQTDKGCGGNRGSESWPKGESFAHRLDIVIRTVFLVLILS